MADKVVTNLVGEHGERLPRRFVDMGDGTFAEVLATVQAAPSDAALALLTDGDADGDWLEWAGGQGFFAVNGTWDGATASLQYSLSGEAASEIVLGADYALTSDGGLVFTLPAGYVRCAVANAGTTSLTAIAKRI